jgi:TusA-related sulfurtransferase
LTGAGEAGLARLYEAAGTRTVEARGTWCPEPLTRLQAAAATARAGETLALVADDPIVEVDVPAWCLSTGNAYLGTLHFDDHLVALVRRSERDQPKR